MLLAVCFMCYILLFFTLFSPLGELADWAGTVTDCHQIFIVRGRPFLLYALFMSEE